MFFLFKAGRKLVFAKFGSQAIQIQGKIRSQTILKINYYLDRFLNKYDAVWTMSKETACNTNENQESVKSTDVPCNMACIRTVPFWGGENSMFFLHPKGPKRLKHLPSEGVNGRGGLKGSPLTFSGGPLL